MSGLPTTTPRISTTSRAPSRCTASAASTLWNSSTISTQPRTRTLSPRRLSRDGIQPINYSGFGEIVVITPLIGGSTVNVTSTSPQTAATSIACEAGDTVVVGADTGHGQHSMESIAGLVSIQTGGGAATIVLDDSGDIDTGLDRTVTFSA